MSGIKRFNHATCEYPGGIFSEMNREADGDYVLHSDHEAEVARLSAEVERLRLVVSQVTECLCDTLHERGGWAIEEVIDMGREAAMGASA